MAQLRELQVPRLFVLPHEPGFMTYQGGGSFHAGHREGWLQAVARQWGGVECSQKSLQPFREDVVTSVILYDTVGGTIDMGKPQGGCETSLVLLRDALVAQGIECRIMREDVDGECDALVIVRYTPAPTRIRAYGRTVVYSVDMPDVRYDQHRHLAARRHQQVPRVTLSGSAH